jgi:hypothetical protein
MSFRHIRNVRGFFSDYYLGSVFGQKSTGRGSRKSISDRDTDQAYTSFRRIYEKARNQDIPNAPTCRERFIRPLLRNVLRFHLGAGENNIHRLFPSAEAEERGERPLLLVYCGGWDDDLDAGKGKANPMRLLGEALAREEISYGFLVTGERIRLIRSPGYGPQGAYIEVDLAGLSDEEDITSFTAFIKLFSVTTFLPGNDGRRPIEELERESREHAERVSEDLKGAVFRAAESMVAGLIADAVARGEIASPLKLDETTLRTYRDAALLALYRILFILYAEARDPRLDQHELYRKSYSATGLLDEILMNPDRVWPENRCYFWDRLRALFRIYDEGLPAISRWDNIPPRGGDFFSRNTPEGRIIENARLSDRQVAQLIMNLATTTPKRGVGRERVSFRELDIESLGAVYEGLLEYEPRIAPDVLFEVRVQGREYILPPADLVRLCKQKNLVLKGNIDLVRDTEAELLHPADTQDDESADAGEEAVEACDEVVAGEDVEAEEASESEGVTKGANAKLIRRLEPGTFHFVPGPGRKGSGSFYTPRALVQDLVRHTLGPIVEGKTAEEIEKLRVLDPACGSAHFLVEAMRFLGQALHRAYSEQYGSKGPPEFRSSTGQGWDTNWRASDEEARAANSEARAWCKRRIAERCLFGVDLNPTAVQLAQIALWVESLAGDRPLTYFQHHIRCGNSLLGTWMDRLGYPPMPVKGFDQRQLRMPFLKLVRMAISEAARLRRLIDESHPDDLRKEGIQPESVEEYRYKEDLRIKASSIMNVAKLIFDLRSASAFVPDIWKEWDGIVSFIEKLDKLDFDLRSRSWWKAFEQVRERERFFHWELEFPEIFVDVERPGFDAVLGNPPWDKIKPDRKEFYGRYDILIRAYVGGELDRRIRELHAAHPELEAEFQSYKARLKALVDCLKKGGDYRFHDWNVDGRTTGGDPDAFKFFVERAWQLVREGGRVGFVVPSAIYNNEGCTGLRHLILEHAQVERFYAFENRRKVFPIDSRYKFVNLVFRKGKPESDGFEAAFMRHDLAELEATARYREPGKEKVKSFAAPWIVPIRRRELEILSPGTLTFLEYRSPRDREILLKMYGYDAEGNPVNPRPLLGDQGHGTWNARFYTEFHMTNDLDLWTDPKTGKLYNPRQILGTVPGTTDRPPYYDPAAWPEIRSRMAEKGFWPLYEGKHIEQFLVDIRPIERWVSLEACQKKYNKLPDPGHKLVFRAIASNTNERTCIAAVLPERSCAGHTLSIIVSDVPPDSMVSVFNAFPFDFSVRLRTVGAHLSFTYVKRLVVPKVTMASLLPTLTTKSVATIQANHVTDLLEFWDDLWRINRAVAEAYGLTPDEFEYILSTFPVFARKRPKFYKYLLDRVQEWKQEVEAHGHASLHLVDFALAAEPGPVYAKGIVRQPAVEVALKQAVVFAWVVQKLYSFGHPVSRSRVQKMLYFIESATGAGLFAELFKQVDNFCNPDMCCKDLEDIAVSQKGWLTVHGDSRFEPGSNIEEVLQYAPQYIDTELAEIVLEDFHAFDDATLEQWSIVHFSAVELHRQGNPVTPENVLAYIRSVPEWQPRFSQKGITQKLIADAIKGLARFGLLAEGGKQ